MKNRISRFFAIIRQKLFTFRADREIYGRIFPQLRQEAECGYPFSSIKEMSLKNKEAFITTQSMLRMLEGATSKMPEAEGEAFKHIAYCDLQKRIWQQIEFATERISSSECDPQCVATRLV